MAINDTRIIRVPLDTDFTILSNHTLQDERLSFGALGLLAYMLSLPEDWKISVQAIAASRPEGKFRVYSLIRELWRYGYFHRLKFREKNGDWGSVAFVLPVANPSFSADEWLSSRRELIRWDTVQWEAYKEQTKKEKIATQSGGKRRKVKIKVPKRESTAKKVGKYRFTLNTNISAEFTAHANNLGLNVYEIGWIYNNFRLFWAIKKANVQQPAEWWLEQWKKSIGRYIEDGRRYKNKTDFNFGGSDERKSAGDARAEQLERIIRNPESIPRIRITS
jgi:hypothetical protein